MVMTESVADSVMEYAFNLRLWQSPFLIKLQAFTINGSDRVWDGVCF